jgi:hypothetical protein
MKLPAVKSAVLERGPGADFESIAIEDRARKGLITAVAGVAQSYQDAEASSEFITGKAAAKRRRNALHRKLSQPSLTIEELGDTPYDEKDVRDGRVATYLVGDKIWETETSKIKTETMDSFKHQKSKNEFNARWADSDEESRDMVLKQMERGAKVYHKDTKAVEFNQALKDRDWMAARENLEFLRGEEIYDQSTYDSKKAGLNKYIESDNAYDLINNQDVDGMKAEKARLQDKEGKYKGPRSEQERKALISELNTGINQANSLASSGIAELNNQSADYVQSLWGGGELDPTYRARVDSAAANEGNTAAQTASLNKLSREIAVAEEYTGRRNVMITATPDEFEKQYAQAVKATDKIKDRRVRDSALQGVKKTYDYRRNMLATDPSGYAIETNPDVQESFALFNQALFSGNVEEAAAYYGEYRAMSQSTQESYGVDKTTILPKSGDYQAGFSEMLNNSTVQQKKAIAGSFAGIVGTDLIQVANELSGSNPAFVGGMMNMSLNKVAADKIFKGMEVVDDISKSDWTNAMNEIFDGVEMDQRDQKALMASLSAHYKGAASADQLKDGVNSELMEQAIADLIGPKVDAGGLRSSKVYSFRGDDNEWVTPYRFNNVLDRTDNDALLETHGVTISVGSSRDATEIIKNADLIPAGDGMFYLKVQNSNPSGTNYGAIEGIVRDSNGNDFVLDMRKLNRHMDVEMPVVPMSKGVPAR